MNFATLWHFLLVSELVWPVYLVPVAGETGAVSRSSSPPPTCARQRLMADHRNSPDVETNRN